MKDGARLIEVGFPLEAVSLDSVHEKNVRHGHISTLHIWPARRPLAACRAALIGALLPDPGDENTRKEIHRRLAGKVTGEKIGGSRRGTVGGVLHWGRENGPDLDWFRKEIRKAHGGRAPRVLDPFAGGGAIPLEAMRLGCEAAAIDINPVAWLLLKCTLEHPRKLAGRTLPLPDFARRDRDFMESFLKAKGATGADLEGQLAALGLGGENHRQPPIHPERKLVLEGDLAWQLRAWGRRVLERVRQAVGHRYPTFADKPTVAYLWARTVACKRCRATLPLLKTGWLAKKTGKRARLTMTPKEDGTGVAFGIETGEAKDAPGTMSRTGARCPCCQTIMTMQDLRVEGRAGRLGEVMTAVVVDGPDGKEYRLPEEAEIRAAEVSAGELDALYADIPFGLPTEPICAERPSPNSRGASGLPRYGFHVWKDIFTDRQLLTLGSVLREVRQAGNDLPPAWREAIAACLALSLGRLADYSSAFCSWHNSGEKMRSTYARFALPMVWDFAEVNPLSGASGNFLGGLEWIARVVEHLSAATRGVPKAKALRQSAIESTGGEFDLICTDPPYYDAIPYSDLMDFFHVWLRRALHGVVPDADQAFADPLGPKWDRDSNDGELVDQSSRFAGDQQASRKAYEDGMARAFDACRNALKEDGRLVVVFANKSPIAWETLATALIRSGFTVTGSWPIQTEMQNKLAGGARLASSVWLVCRKRPASARPGWDAPTLAAMRETITQKLRDFWDAGIRGPDFVWAATGPALEAFSRHPVVKKADEPGELLTVSDFLRHVRRMVVDFVVGRVLGSADRLDDVTAYYLLHRDFYDLDEAPAGASILYALACGLSDRDLSDRFAILARPGRAAEEGDGGSGGGGGKVRLLPWERRDAGWIGEKGPGGRPVPLIDRAHRLMHLWREGDEKKVNAYLLDHRLGRNALFASLLQALIEMAPGSSDERSTLEALSHHLDTGRAIQRGLWK